MKYVLRDVYGLVCNVGESCTQQRLHILQNSSLCEQCPKHRYPLLCGELNNPRQLEWKVLSWELWQINPRLQWIVFTKVSAIS